MTSQSATRNPKSETRNADLSLRPATEADVPLILEFIRGIAEYEKLSHEVKATEADLRDSLFGARPVAECILAFWKGTPAGFAVYFHNFSTFMGRRGLYLEDLFVNPEFRGLGIGKGLLLLLAKIARDRGCSRFEWAVLDWNTPAIEFYLSLGAESMDQWTIFRLTEESIRKLSG
jgi:GNAT superfamily N-acetyltransferase